MYKWFIRKTFGTQNERDLKKLQPFAFHVNELEPQVQKLSNDELAAKTGYFKEKLNQGASPDDLADLICEVMDLLD